MTPLIESIRVTPVVASLTIETILILAALAGALTFVVAYPTLADPRRWTREGWHMWLFTLGLTSLGGSSITRRLWPETVEHPAYTVAILTTYSLLAVLMWHRCWLLWTARRHDQILHERRETDHE